MQLATQRYVRCRDKPIDDGSACFVTPGSTYRLNKTVSDPATGEWHQITADDGNLRNYQAKYFEAPFTCIDGEAERSEARQISSGGIIA